MSSNLVTENDILVNESCRFIKKEEEKFQKEAFGANEGSFKAKFDKLENQEQQRSHEFEYMDITEQKKFQDQLKDWKQKKEMSSRNKDERLKEGPDHRIQTGFKAENVENVKSSKVNFSNHKNDNILKRNHELSKGKSDVSKDANVGEMKLNECCKRKRSQYELECDDCSLKFQGSGLTCIGILPGLGSNIDSSDDSDQSCSSGSENNENVKYDLLGRRIVFEAKESSGSR